MKQSLRRAADVLQRTIARSTLLVRAAVLVRNQCRCIIKYHLAESPEVNDTGEVWLRTALAPACTSFVDVGANVGDWLGGIVTEKRTSGFRAVAYEPSLSAFQKLSQRFDRDDRITLRNCAVGDAPGEFEFYEEHGAGKGSSLVSAFVRMPGFKRAVQVVRLDDEMDALALERVDFLKIDAEGYDMRVMAGAQGLFRGGRIGAVQFEYNRGWQLAGDTLYAAMEFLRRFGYEIFVLKRDGLYSLDYELYEEYFEYSNFVALSPRFAEVKQRWFRGTI